MNMNRVDPNNSNILLLSQRYVASLNPMHQKGPFWNTIFQKKCPVIVKLNKEEYYWPAAIGTAELYQGIEVTLNQEQSLSSSLTKRQFTLKKGSVTHTLVHLEFSEWQIFKSPKPDKFQALLKSVDEHYQPKKGPLSVHCQGGIGRTGTFIAIHCTQKTKNPDFDAIIPDMRRQRNPKMVETEEQRRFVITQHRISVPDEEECYWYSLSGLSSLFFQSIPLNPYYNSTLIRLLKDKYLASSNPQYDPETFWKKVFNEKLPVIVMLNGAAPYWPKEFNKYVLHGNTFTGYVKVALVKETAITPFICKREFLLKQEGKPQKVIHLAFSGWVDGEAPNSENFQSLLSEVNKHYKSNQKPLVVHCEGGCGRTGTFIAVHATQKVTNPNFDALIESMRKQRSRGRMVETFTQKKFIIDQHKKGGL